MLAGLAALFILSALLACSSGSENVEADLAGANIFGDLPLFQFRGEVDNTLVSSCGSATAQTTSTGTTGTTTTTTTGSGSGSGTQAATAYKIASFYIFNNSLLGGTSIDNTATMLLKYTYFTNRDSFSLTPTSSSTSTCTTADFVTCNTSGTFTCNTTDNQTCGGEQAFIFASTLTTPTITFEAASGTVNWSGGFSLTSDNTGVGSATLEFNFTNSAGTKFFVGKVTCVSDEQ